MTEFKRDRWDRPLIPPLGPDGRPDLEAKPVPYMRISKLAGVTDDGYNLMLWQQRTTALGLHARPDLVERVGDVYAKFDDPLNNPDAKRLMKAICAEAHIAGGGDYASKRGSHLHILTEYVDRGEPLPDETVHFQGKQAITMPTLRQDHETMEKYHASLKAAGIVPIWIELAVVNDHYRAAGTLDRVFRMPDGTVRVADYKTGAHDHLYPSKVCCQVRTYATAKRIDPATGERAILHPDLDESRGLLIHQPDRGDGTCTIYDLNLEAAVPVLEAGMRVLDVRSIPKKDFIAPYGAQV